MTTGKLKATVQDIPSQLPENTLSPEFNYLYMIPFGT
jgi:hypothetical protein